MILQHFEDRPDDRRVARGEGDIGPGAPDVKPHRAGDGKVDRHGAGP